MSTFWEKKSKYNLVSNQSHLYKWISNSNANAYFEFFVFGVQTTHATKDVTSKFHVSKYNPKGKDKVPTVFANSLVTLGPNKPQ